MIGDYNQPGEGLVQLFARDLEEFKQAGDQIKFSYLNVCREDLFDYFSQSEVRFGLIETKRSFSGQKEHLFSSAEHMSGLVNSVLPFHSDKHQTMGGYSRSCIPVLRFEVARE